jgi:hypothetical protein
VAPRLFVRRQQRRYIWPFHIARRLRGRAALVVLVV